MRHNVKEMAAWFHKEYGGGIIQTLDPMGKIQMSRENPSSCQLAFLFFVPNHLWDWLGEVISMGWERYEIKFEFGKSPIFGKCVFDLWGK